MTIDLKFTGYIETIENTGVCPCCGAPLKTAVYDCGEIDICDACHFSGIKSDEG